MHADSIPQQMNQLLQGRVDLAVGISGTHLPFSGEGKPEIIPIPISTRSAFIATSFSAQHAGLFEQIESALLSMEQQVQGE